MMPCVEIITVNSHDWSNELPTVQIVRDLERSGDYISLFQTEP